MNEERYQPDWIKNPTFQTILSFTYQSIYDLVVALKELKNWRKNEK